MALRRSCYVGSLHPNICLLLYNLCQFTFTIFHHFSTKVASGVMLYILKGNSLMVYTFNFDKFGHIFYHSQFSHIIISFSDLEPALSKSMYFCMSGVLCNLYL